MSKTTTAPRPETGSLVRVPPCNSTIDRQIDRPNPVPITFRREHSRKQPLAVFSPNPSPPVGNHNLEPFLRRACQRNIDCTVQHIGRAQCLNSVVDEVERDLLNFGPVGVGVYPTAIAIDGKRNPLLTTPALQVSQRRSMSCEGSLADSHPEICVTPEIRGLQIYRYGPDSCQPMRRGP